jgi:TATA-box binding protein (TBP) (component of TFIID and TFIIIB)
MLMWTPQSKVDFENVGPAKIENTVLCGRLVSTVDLAAIAALDPRFSHSPEIFPSAIFSDGWCGLLLASGEVTIAGDASSDGFQDRVNELDRITHLGLIRVV